jgi:hypothetical protein
MAKKPTKKQQKEISEGVKSMVREYEDTGKIKTTRATYEPENKGKAIKQALAIEYGEHQVSSRNKKSKRKDK